MIAQAQVFKPALPSKDCLTAPLSSPKDADVVFVHGARQLAKIFSDRNDVNRVPLESFIKKVFEGTYGAEIKHFMPQLMGLTDQNNRLLAVCGLRHARLEPLFLEHYMTEPVENLLSKRTGLSTQREEIVEIGNLAVAEPGMARQLLAGVIDHLHGTSAQWAVFTAIPSLRNSLAKLNVHLEVLCEARLECLPKHERTGWGSYYQQNPQVMAVRRMPQFSH